MKLWVRSDPLGHIRFKKSLIDPKGYTKANTEEQTKHH